VIKLLVITPLRGGEPWQAMYSPYARSLPDIQGVSGNRKESVRHAAKPSEEVPATVRTNLGTATAHLTHQETGRR